MDSILSMIMTVIEIIYPICPKRLKLNIITYLVNKDIIYAFMAWSLVTNDQCRLRIQLIDLWISHFSINSFVQYHAGSLRYSEKKYVYNRYHDELFDVNTLSEYQYILNCMLFRALLSHNEQKYLLKIAPHQDYWEIYRWIHNIRFTKEESIQLKSIMMLKKISD